MTTDAEVPVPKLDESTPQTELPGLDSQPEASTEQPKRRRRRRRTTQPEQPVASPEEQASQEEQQFAQALAMGFDFGGQIVAGLRGAHWKFKPEEVNTLGAVWAKALHPYMGSLAPYTPFIVATIVTAGVMFPRVQQDRLIRAENAGIIPIQRAQIVATVPAENVAPADNGSSPELNPPEPMPGTLGAEQVKRTRRRGTGSENPPGIS